MKLKFSQFVFVFAWVVFAFFPFQVRAFDQAPTAKPFCADTGDYPTTSSGLCLDGSEPDLCQAGYNYDASKKICVLKSTPTPTPTPTPSPTSGTTTTTTGGTCETGFKNNNGICVPDYFKTGVASSTTIGTLATLIIRVLLTLSGMVAVVLIIIGGFQFILSRGNEEAATKGKKTLTYAVIGLIVVIMSFVIVSVVTGTLTNDNFLGNLVGSGSGSGGSTGPGPTPR